MNLKNIMSIHNFLLGIVTVAGLNIHPKPASAAAKHLNITLAPGAIDTLQAHDLWTPSAAGLNGIEPMFDDHFNATLENEKFKASGLDINSLIYIGVNDYNSKEATSMANAGGETGIANVDVDVCAPYPDCCKQCHTCEEACLSGIIFLLLPWLICEGACRAQGYCKDTGCD